MLHNVWRKTAIHFYHVVNVPAHAESQRLMFVCWPAHRESISVSKQTDQNPKNDQLKSRKDKISKHLCAHSCHGDGKPCLTAKRYAGVPIPHSKNYKVYMSSMQVSCGKFERCWHFTVHNLVMRHQATIWKGSLVQTLKHQISTGPMLLCMFEQIPVVSMLGLQEHNKTQEKNNSFVSKNSCLSAARR